MSDIEECAREGISCAQPHEEDVADLGAFGVQGGEEAGAGAGGVEGEELRGGFGCDGVWAEFVGGAGWWDDGDGF